jgi:predicted nucleic acid-binding protein
VTLVAVVDTNVVVSGVLAAAKSSPTARILDAMIAGTLHFLLSDDLLAEYRAVLLRPVVVARHGLSTAEVDALLADLVMNASWREPAPAPPHPVVPGDEHVIALLEAEPQAVLVTGDRRLREAVGAVRAALTPAETILAMAPPTDQ